ncbi:MAG: hypothetical protein K8R69_02535 [Deltaproteobacteria bacterium]|nr:hypothetical protein [Deltaproteobacteria bacterium]
MVKQLDIEALALGFLLDDFHLFGIHLVGGLRLAGKTGRILRVQLVLDVLHGENADGRALALGTDDDAAGFVGVFAFGMTQHHVEDVTGNLQVSLHKI